MIAKPYTVEELRNRLSTIFQIDRLLQPDSLAARGKVE
jgi:hypothetical protein